MTKKPFDQFAKQFFNTFLSPYGRVDLNFEVPGESQFIDILFAPSTQPNETPESLRLLHRIASVPCVIEPYRKPPDKSDIRSCVQKMFFVQADYERKANAEERIVNEEELPSLWIITPTASDQIREYCISSPSANWGKGIYTSPGVLRVAIIVANKLPRTPETLFFRLFGTGKVQERAIKEVKALPLDDKQRPQILKLLSSWKITIEVEQPTNEDERRLAMLLEEVYQEWEEKTRRQGLEQGRELGQSLLIENMLKARFGELDSELTSIIPLLLALPTEEYANLLLSLSNISRSDLIARFK
ncbi:hypothetical protein NIES4071_86870 [Calothrix sp. NIES-4071]|nr:hypothetical protein NIES4071_86870 [Calothrix sp. NIES-4071]BAZ62954.1 hypothetical protein NIES4105_86800 [Calothrix sp. NIES-4105]